MLNKKVKKTKYTIEQFRRDYPTEAVCLDKLFSIRYGNIEGCPRCGTHMAEFKRLPKRRCYQCRECYYQIYPTAGTIFAKTTTPLTYWFYAMYLMTATRNGVSAKELERQLGVTYKTAWRMAHCLRELMKDISNKKLKGFVEIDETFVGPKSTTKGRNNSEKAVILGMVERLGNVVTYQVPDTTRKTVYPIIEDHVDKTAKVMTDEYSTYISLKTLGYHHQTIRHYLKEWSRGEVSTNTIEGYFSQLKRMIFGTHINISKKHIQKYLDECAFRYNNRRDPGKMFEALMENVMMRDPWWLRHTHH